MASGRLILPLAEPCLSAAGAPQNGASLTVYETGTTTLAALFSDEALSVPILNPQTSNSAGRFYQQSTSIWADDAIAYDCLLTFPNGETFTYDAVWLVGAPEAISGYAPLDSPAFTGTPTAPTPAANDASSKIATTQFVASAIAAAAFIPPGIVAPFACNPPPSGWLICDGTAVSRATYAALFGTIGTTFGAGDGVTTFNLPDLRGRFVRGFSGSGTIDPARVFGSNQDDAFQGHYHTPLGTSTGSQFGFNVWSTSTGSAHGAPTGSGSNQEVTTGNATTNGTNGTPRTASETRPTNVALIYAIKS
jgi:microcystin-dependent protein